MPDAIELCRSAFNHLLEHGTVFVKLVTLQITTYSVYYPIQLWYFERVGLVSHMTSLILKASIALNETSTNQAEGTPRIDSSWNSADERNVSIRTQWDNSKLHDEVL